MQIKYQGEMNLTRVIVYDTELFFKKGEVQDLPEHLARKILENANFSKVSDSKSRIVNLSKLEQLRLLKDLGVSDSVISTLNSEESRVNKILELQK